MTVLSICFLIAVFVGLTAFVEHENDWGSLGTIVLGVFFSYQAFDTPLHTYFLDSWVTYVGGIVAYILIGALLWSPTRWKMHLKSWRDVNFDNLKRLKEEAEKEIDPADYDWTDEKAALLENYQTEMRELDLKIRASIENLLPHPTDRDAILNHPFPHPESSCEVVEPGQEEARKLLKDAYEDRHEMELNVEALKKCRNQYNFAIEDQKDAANSHEYLMRETYVRNNKVKITRWILFWIFDATWQLTKHPIKALSRLVYHIVEGWYIKIRKKILGDLDLVGKINK
jgi:hypothetical protein